MPVALSEILHPDAAAAEAALAAIGADHDPRLDLVTEVDGFGKVARRFATLRSPLSPGPVTDRRLVDHFVQLLARPENAKLKRQAGDLTFCPVNKTIVKQLSEGLLARKVHLPWALRPMNIDVASKIGKAHRAKPFPFEAFYAQAVQVSRGAPSAPTSAPPVPAALKDRRTLIGQARPGEPAPAGLTITTGRLFSMPISGNPDSTMMEPDDDNALDDRIGLLLEADAPA